MKIVGVVNMPIFGEANKPSDDRENVINCLGVNDKDGNISSRIIADLQTNRYNCLKIFFGKHLKGDAADKLLPIYEIARVKKIPVVLDFSNSVQDEFLKFGPPLHVDETAVISRYNNEIPIKDRRINFVIAHCGSPWIQDAAQVAYKNLNVYLECSIKQIEKIRQTNLQNVGFISVNPLKWIYNYVEHPERIMYGSDYPQVKGENLKDNLQYFKDSIPGNYRNKVFSENAACLYKFSSDFKKKNKIEVDCRDYWRNYTKEDLGLR